VESEEIVGFSLGRYCIKTVDELPSPTAFYVNVNSLARQNLCARSKSGCSRSFGQRHRPVKECVGKRDRFSNISRTSPAFSGSGLCVLKCSRRAMPSLPILGAATDGKKEPIVVELGYRESEHSADEKCRRISKQGDWIMNRSWRLRTEPWVDRSLLRWLLTSGSCFKR